MTLDQLASQFGQVPPGAVEILISDNCSPDATAQVVSERISSAFPLRYLRNDENIGSDANIAQCFNLARGRYVLLLGDDDLPVDGALPEMLSYLRDNYGVVCLRPYGYEHDFRREYPGGQGEPRPFSDTGDFLAAIGPYMTLISSCLINKTLLSDVDARSFCGGNLVQVHLVMLAALRAPRNLFVDQYKIACKRNNSGGYDFSKVFVEEFYRVLDSGRASGMDDRAVRKIETRMLIGYYPTYLLRQRVQRSGELSVTKAIFEARFGRRLLYRLWLAPILQLPRPPAIAWGMLATLLGRAAFGDLRRGLAFARNRFKSG